MSNRLESLNSKKPSGKPSLKFKPKVVERKSKEERDKVKVKQEPDTKPFKPKGNRPKPKGKQNGYANTHVLSSGLLSSATPSVGPPGSSSGFSGPSGASGAGSGASRSSPAPDFLQSLRRNDTPRSTSPEDSDDDDLTRIDMSRDYKFAVEDTVLFPRRPTRGEPEQEPTVSKEQSPVKEDPEFVRESSVKSENIETELQQILDTKADLESKISQPVDLLDKEESEKLYNDYTHIHDTINDKFGGGSSFTLLQLPKLLPEYTRSSVKTEPESVDEVTETTGTNGAGPVPGPAGPGPFAADVTKLTGQIGKLNIHKSGKVSLSLGNDINLGLTVGVGSNFLQELVVLDYSDKPKTEKTEDEMDQDKGAIHKLGDVDGKFIATPII